jgi:murein DD-endopeptidase MepM/ murein hydrolase activator NlpD
MATIDAKKLLPPSKKAGAIERQKFLVPLQNISTNRISTRDLRPVDRETSEDESLSIIKKKINQLSLLLNESYLIDKKEREKKRKEQERSKSEQREKKLEEKVKKNQVSSNLIPSIPGQSIFDKINRFIGFTLLGYLFNKYGELLPKLMEFGKVLKPVANFIESFAKNLLKGVVDFVEFGYKAYDQTRDFVKQIGGEGAQKTFDEFSKNFNLMLNGAIGAAMLIASTAPKSSRGTGGTAGGLGAGTGAAASSAVSAYSQTAAGKSYAAMQQFRNLPKWAQSISASSAGRYSASQSRIIGGTANIGDKLRVGTRRFIPGMGDIAEKIATKGSTQAAKQLGTQTAKQSLKSLTAVPIIGALIGFIIDTVVFREKPSRAAAGAVGSAIGQGLGIAIAGGTTFGIGAGIGMFVGGFAGDWLGKAIYDALTGYKQPPLEGRAEGGQISGGGQASVATSRRIKTTTRKAPPRIQPQKTQPGRDVGGKLKIEELYGKDTPGVRSGTRALRKSSEDIKKMRSINGLAGSMFGAGIDMALGQKPDKNLSRNLGNIFGSVISSAVDMELNKSFGDISKTIAMAGGGAVPSREIGRQLSIGERIGSFISRALAVSIESSASRILQNLRKEMNLEGGGSGTDGAPPGEVPPAEISEDQKKASDDLIKYFEKLYGKNAAIGIVANLLRESGLRTTTPDNSSFEGMAQWDRANRWPAFVKWAQSKGKDPYSRSAQAEWIAIELKQLGTDARLKNAKTPEEAASLFYNEFERAAYSKPILGDKYTPDNPHERKNRSFIQSLTGGSAGGGPPAMVTGGLKPSQIPETSPQGWRWGKMHKGIDLDGGDGSPISSAQDATVVWAGDKGDGYGNSVILRYSNGAETRFAHLKTINVRTGQSIKASQLIGRQGNTGRSTASHLHFEYYPKGGAMTYDGYGNAASVKDSYFRYGGNVKPKPLNKPADIFNNKDEKSQDKNKPSAIFDWKKASLAPSQPQSPSVAFAGNEIRKTDTSTMVYNNNAVAILPMVMETA